MNRRKSYPKDAAKNPDNVLEQAMGHYESVFVIGYDVDGELDVRSTLNLEPEEIIFMLERFKYKLFNGDYE